MTSASLTHVATLCGKCDCGCPEVFVAPHAEPDKRVVITDDFGQKIQMSAGQFQDLVDKARAGAFDAAIGLLPSA
ncbi:hypothetical protein [Actinomadura rayongensis]|uniref:DUF397 domain-containing protein n=1 Tax=Actinomadura rayongensis TaxID=1429076 RepID=A0A6I4W672_9ACTN|nr:hypothetical protein [Actinomadura rayongensis]MXQ64270.1 hypothetical protein [Actinomadura rayongensis]